MCLVTTETRMALQVDNENWFENWLPIIEEKGKARDTVRPKERGAGG